MREFSTIAVVSSPKNKNEVIVILAPELDSCEPREVGEFCGGCDMCLLRQAEYYEYNILYIDVDKRILEGLYKFLKHSFRYV